MCPSRYTLTIKCINLFIYLWLRWIFTVSVSFLLLQLVVATLQSQLLMSHFSSRWLLLQSTGYRASGLQQLSCMGLAGPNRFCCRVAHGIVLHPHLNLCPLPRHVGPYPLSQREVLLGFLTQPQSSGMVSPILSSIQSESGLLPPPSCCSRVWLFAAPWTVILLSTLCQILEAPVCGFANTAVYFLAARAWLLLVLPAARDWRPP